MIVIIMAGGSGSRLGGVEKPLLAVCGRPMLEAALRAAEALGEPALCVSPRAPTVARLYCGEVKCAQGLGDYVQDLSRALSIFGAPALVMPADMPFVDRAVDRLGEFVRRASSSSSDVVTLEACSSSGCRQPGISFFRSPAGGSWEDYELPWDPSLMDVDTEQDLREAEGLCGYMGVGRGPSWTSA